MGFSLHASCASKDGCGSTPRRHADLLMGRPEPREARAPEVTQPPRQTSSNISTQCLLLPRAPGALPLLSFSSEDRASCLDIQSPHRLTKMLLAAEERAQQRPQTYVWLRTSHSLLVSLSLPSYTVGDGADGLLVPSSFALAHPRKPGSGVC